jgi:aminopeptidase N
MYATLLGREGFRRGMDLYFKRHDGQAVTCDDFRAAMADANGVGPRAVRRWYAQAGTPVVEVRGVHDLAAPHLYAAPAPELPGHARASRRRSLS